MTDINRPFKVRKKGKTRGRRSKVEKVAEALMARYWTDHEEEFQIAHRRWLLYGEAMTVDKDGHIKNATIY